MTAPTVAPAIDLAQAWRTTTTVAKTCVALLAIIGAAHITEPMRADAAPATVQQHVEPTKPARVAPGK